MSFLSPDQFNLRLIFFILCNRVDGFRLTDANDLAINDLNKQKVRKDLS